MSIKNSNDTVGNRTRNLPASNAVPQPTEPPRTIGLEIKWSSTSTMLQGTFLNVAHCFFFSRLGSGSVSPNRGSAKNHGINLIIPAKILEFFFTAVGNTVIISLYIQCLFSCKGKGKVHPCTGTEALCRPYGP